MSEVFDRLLCASANGQCAPVDADDVRELIDLYERTPGEHPAPEGPFHLNEYLTDRAFGGPEEGGWWYDTGRFVACHGTYPTVNDAAAARRHDGVLARRPAAGAPRPVPRCSAPDGPCSTSSRTPARTSRARARATSER